MNGYLLISGAMIICFADREMGNITLKSGTKIGVKYPLFGVIIFVAGLLLQ